MSAMRIRRLRATAVCLSVAAALTGSSAPVADTGQVSTPPVRTTLPTPLGPIGQGLNAAVGPSPVLPPLPSLTAAQAAIEGPAPVRPSTGQSGGSTGQSRETAAPPVPTWGQVFEYWRGRLPGTYVVEDLGTWGATVVPPGTVHIAPRTPIAWLPSIMQHESMHVRQHRIWGDDVNKWHAALAPYGGIEEVADCGARLLGATKFSYTATCTGEQLRAARAILSGVAP